MLKEKFIRYIEFEKRYSAHTIAAYSSDLDQFLIYLNAQFQTDDLISISHFQIRSWIVSLIEAKINTRSVNRKITVLKSFYKFLMKEGLLVKNPMLKIQSPKNAKRLPVFVEKGKMTELLNRSTNEDDFENTRNHFILELFYQTGMRVSELTNLKLIDINHSNQTIKVLGKRNKERIIPFTSSLTNVLENYLAKRKLVLNDANKLSDYLFISQKCEAINRRWIYGMVKNELGSVTTLQKRSPHVLRHTFATHMLDNGADINAIKELLGHSSLAATQVYTHNTIEKLKNIYKQAHPKA